MRLAHLALARLAPAPFVLALLVLALLVPAAGGAGRTVRRAPALEPDLALAAGRSAPIGAGTQASAARIPYQGGPVLNANRTHVIFWQPAGSGLTFDPGYVALVEQFLHDVAADSHMTANELAITGQYRDAAGPAAYASRFAGGVLDVDPLPRNGCTEPASTGPGWTVCLTDQQLQAEIKRFIGAYQLAPGGDNIYLLVTPQGLGSCTDASSQSCALGGPATGYCGYHSATPGGLLYAVIPYNAVPGHCQSTNPRPNASTADPALSTISHELAETVTDPLGNAWINGAGEEIADVCISDYGRALGGSGAGRWDETIAGHHYWLQELFSRIRDRCEPRPQRDEAAVVLAGRARARFPLALRARAHQPGGAIVSYSWRFGDGGTGRGRAVIHTWTRPGVYRVRLRVVDAAGSWAYARRSVRVAKPGGAIAR